MGNAWERLTARLPRAARAGLFGVGWSGMAQGVSLAVRLASNLIMTRFLAPADYGVFGAALAVTTTLEWLSDLGIQPALVRHPKGDTRAYLLTGWWMGLGRAAFLFLTCAALAWPVSQFWYPQSQVRPDAAVGVLGLAAAPGAGPLLGATALAPETLRPELFFVLLLLGLRPVLMALHSPALPTLQRRINYRALFFSEVGQTVVGTAVSIFLGWAWRSVWAIVAGTLAGALAGVFISYVLCPMRPRFLWDREANREIGVLGKQVFVNTLIMALWLNFDRLVGPIYIDAKAMGYYVVAMNLANVVENLITRACDVYFSLLTRLPDAETQQEWHRRACDRAAWWGMPPLAAATVLAPLAIHILYDRRYAGAAILFALMIARLIFRGLGQIQFQYLLASARVGPASWAYAVALIVEAVLFVPAVHVGGAIGLAALVLASTAVVTLTQMLLMRKLAAVHLTPFYLAAGWTAVALLPLYFLS